MKVSKSIKKLSAAAAVVMVSAVGAWACFGPDGQPSVGTDGEPLRACTEVQAWGVGANVTATLEDGTLTVSGTGPINNYEPALDGFPPWFNWATGPLQRDDILYVKIEEGVTHIGSNLFIGLTALQSIEIPKSVTSIGVSEYFERGIPNVYILGTVPPGITANPFGNVGVVYVPEESVETYGSADVWKDFDIQPLPSDVTSVTYRSRKTAAANKFGVVVNGGSLQIVGLPRAAQLRIYDMRGKVMMSRAVSPNERVSVSHLARGTYVVRALDKNVKFTR